MTTTLLQAVNGVFKLVGEIDSVSPDLTTLMDSPRQSQIDLAVHLWRTALEYVQGFADLPGDIGAGTITLVDGTREYDLAAGFQGFVGDDSGAVFLVCNNPQYVVGEYIGGYKQMFVDQPDPTLFTGQPGSFVLNPVTTKIRLDRTPTSAEAGQILTYLYDKTLSLTLATDVLPIPDAAVDVLTGTVAQVYRLAKQGRLDGNIWKIGVAEAIRITARTAKDASYG